MSERVRGKLVRVEPLGKQIGKQAVDDGALKGPVTSVSGYRLERVDRAVKAGGIARVKRQLTSS